MVRKTPMKLFGRQNTLVSTDETKRDQTAPAQDSNSTPMAPSDFDSNSCAAAEGETRP